MPNRNKVIGLFIGKTLGYTTQSFMYCKIANVLNPESAILIKTGTKYGIRLLKHASKNYARRDFSTEKIFSDAIDASFFAD